MAFGKGAQILDVSWAKTGNSAYGFRKLIDPGFDFVTTPAHPLGGGRRYVELTLSNTSGNNLQPQFSASIYETPLAGQRTGLKFSRFYRITGYPNADDGQLLISLGLNWLLWLQSDGKIKLVAPSTTTTTSAASLPLNEDFILIWWIIRRDSGGNLINTHHVLQLVRNPLTTRNTTTLINVQATAQEAISSSDKLVDLWKYNEANLGTGKIYAGTFYAGWEDADSPSGVIRSALGTPSTGTPTYDAWTGVGDTVDKFNNVDEAPPVDTDYNTSVGEQSQSHHLPNTLVPASGNDILFTQQPCWWDSVDQSKTENFRLLITDGTNTLYTVDQQIVNAGYQNCMASATAGLMGDYGILWQVAPDSAEWTPAKLDALEIGYNWNAGATGMYVSATHLFVCYYATAESIPAPPGPPSGAARRIFIC